VVGGAIRSRGGQLIRELWNRHMDARRALSVGLGVVAYGLFVLVLAVSPGLITSSSADAGWLAWSAPALGGSFGIAVRGYVLHRRTGTRNGLRWGLALGGLMLLVILGMFALAILINPIVGSSPTFGGDAPLGLLAIGAVVGLCSNVLWERNRNRQQIAGMLLVVGCLIIAGIVGLRAGEPWSPIGTAFLVVGVLGAAAAALLAWSELVEATGDPLI
jgi:hypothetical protein